MVSQKETCGMIGSLGLFPNKDLFYTLNLHRWKSLPPFFFQLPCHQLCLQVQAEASVGGLFGSLALFSTIEWDTQGCHSCDLAFVRVWSVGAELDTICTIWRRANYTNCPSTASLVSDDDFNMLVRLDYKSLRYGWSCFSSLQEVNQCLIKIMLQKQRSEKNSKSGKYFTCIVK